MKKVLLSISQKSHSVKETERKEENRSSSLFLLSVTVFRNISHTELFLKAKTRLDLVLYIIYIQSNVIN